MNRARGGKVISYRELYPMGSVEYQNADEHNHQVAFVEFVRKEFPELYISLFSIPNGGSRNRVEAANLKMEGLKPGVPDLFLSHPIYFSGGHMHGLYIEMKRPSGSYGLADKQSEFIQAHYKKGYACAVCYGWGQAVAALLLYVGNMGKAEAQERFGLDTKYFPF